MKKTAVAIIIGSLTLAGCQDKPKTEAPTNQQAAAQQAAPGLPPGHPPVGGVQPPPDGKPGAAPGASQGGTKEDPHAGLKNMPVPAGVPTKSGKALQVLDGGQYIYLEIQHEDGKKAWVATLPMKVAAGDKVKYADAPPIPNFPSKSLNRTFDALVLSQAVEVIK